MPARPPAAVPFKPVPEGTFAARLQQVIVEGTLENTFQGQVKHQLTVRLAWEIFSKEKRDDGNNFTIGQKYTFSYDDRANLRKVVEGMLGRKMLVGEVGGKDEEILDLATLIGKECMVTVMHKVNETTGRISAKVATVTAPAEGLKVPAATYETLYFNIEEFAPENMEVFNMLPDYIQDEVKTSPEYKKAMGYEVPKPKVNEEGEINIDDIPF